MVHHDRSVRPCLRVGLLAFVSAASFACSDGAMSPVSPSTSMMTGVRSSAAAALAAEPLTVMSNAAGVTVLDLDARQTVLEGGLTTRGIVTLSAAAP